MVEDLLGRSEAERRAAAPALIARHIELRRELRTDARIRVALLGCATRSELRRMRVVFDAGSEEGIAVLADRRPPWLRDWLIDEMESARDWGVPPAWFAIRALERAGLVEPLDTDASIAGMAMALTHGDGALAELRADPELIERVWRLFEVEGGQTGSLARADKYVSEAKSWRRAFLSLDLDRERLLDATLAALGRDFPSFRAQWFARLHEDLAPTAEERAARADAYLALLSSSVDGTVAFAVRALGEACPDDEALQASLPAALASQRKGTVTAALKLVTDPVVAAGAMQHPAADVQSRALDAVERLGVSDAAREALGAYRDVVAAPVRARYEALACVAPAAAEAVPRRAGVVPEALEPPRDVEALAALLVRVLEQTPPEPDDFDLALDGIARLCGEPVGDALAPVLRRARSREGHPVARVLVAWADGTWSEPQVERLHFSARMQWLRAAEVASCAVAGRPAQLLATPTLAGGRLAPDVLAARRADGAGAGPVDEEQAARRADVGVPEVRVRVQPLARGLRWPVAVEFVSMPGGVVAEGWAGLISGWIPGLSWEEGPAGVRRLRSTWPAFSEGLAALGAARLTLGAADSVSGGTELLGGLLDPSAPIGPAALVLLAVGLGAEDEASGLAAADAAAVALGDGRLGADALASAVRDALACGVGAPRRLARRLGALAVHAPDAARLVAAALPPVCGREAHHVLELLDDLCARTGVPVEPPETRDWLAAQRGSSKTARLARALLARG